VFLSAVIAPKVIPFEAPTNPSLDQNIAAIKFRYRWYIRKMRLSFKSHQKLYQKWHCFKALTIAIKCEIELQLQNRKLMIKSKMVKILSEWKVSFHDHD
jgi:hypothetical protein